MTFQLTPYSSQCERQLEVDIGYNGELLRSTFITVSTLALLSRDLRWVLNSREQINNDTVRVLKL